MWSCLKLSFTCHMKPIQFTDTLPDLLGLFFGFGQLLLNISLSLALSRSLSLWPQDVFYLACTFLYFSKSFIFLSMKAHNISVSQLAKPCVQGWCSFFREGCIIAVLFAHGRRRICSMWLCILCSEQDPHVPTSSLRGLLSSFSSAAKVRFTIETRKEGTSHSWGRFGKK